MDVLLQSFIHTAKLTNQGLYFWEILLCSAPHFPIKLSYSASFSPFHHFAVLSFLYLIRVVFRGGLDVALTVGDSSCRLNVLSLMRRGRVVRRTRSQTGSLPGQRADNNQQQRPGRHRRTAQQPTESNEPGQPTELTSAVPLRRSARLNQGSTQSLSERAIEAEASRRQRRQRTRSLRGTRNTTHTRNHVQPSAPAITEEEDMSRRFNHTQPLDGSGRSYSLQVAVQPPRVARAGVPLYPPLAIQVHIFDAETGEEISGEDEFSSLFAQATLYGESTNSPPLAPPDMFLLSGRLSMSLDLLNDGPGEDSTPLSRQQGSYVIFPDLVINRTGSYRLGISLFKIGGNRRGRHPGDPRGGGGGGGGGTSLEEIKSDVIVVQAGPAPLQIGNIQKFGKFHIAFVDIILQNRRHRNSWSISGIAAPWFPLHLRQRRALLYENWGWGLNEHL